MLMVLSPAKKLDYDSPIRTTQQARPVFEADASTLAHLLRRRSAADLARLMDVSPALAKLNARRYADWVEQPDAGQARQAALAFDGDVYAGLRAPELSDAQLAWAQDRLAILSGLYGVLGPLDLIQPHRLVMGTRLATRRGHTLYEFWGDRIALELQRRLDGSGGEAVLLNLASVEYFKSVDREALQAPVIECVFQDEKNGAWRIISFHAKRARGLMARFIIDHGIDTAAGLRDFAVDGYAYAPAASRDGHLVFRRPQQVHA